MKNKIALNIIPFMALLVSAFFIQCNDTPRCNDGRRNGSEEEVDCGGECPPCYTCDDGFKNQGETLTDCGGNNCNFCPEEWQPLVLPNGFGFSDLYVMDEDVFFAVGGTFIGKTTDGGKNWTATSIPSVPPNGTLRNIHFFDNNRGVVLGVYSNTFAVFGFSLTTNDGGQNWQYHDIQLNGPQSVKYKSPNNVYVFDGFSLRSSNDGGASFNEFPLNGISDTLKPYQAFFENENQGTVLTYKYKQDNSAELYSFLYKTDNGGQNWQLVGPIGSIGLNKFEMFSTKVGIAPSNGLYNWLMTKDGGLSWNPLEIPRTGKLFFANDKKGFLLGEGPVDEQFFSHKTTDGGQTWQPFGYYNKARQDIFEYSAYPTNMRVFTAVDHVFVVDGKCMKIENKP